MIKAEILLKSNSMRSNCKDCDMRDFSVHSINYIWLLCNTIILAVQMSQNGEITSGLSTYLKINVFLHLISSRN